jgi:carboxynorspermidine decarboxylase
MCPDTLYEKTKQAQPDGYLCRIPQHLIMEVPTPCYVVDAAAVEENLRILAGVQDKTDCKILLALKAFSMFSLFGLIKKYLSGVSASSLNEARLGFEEFGGRVHIVAPAYKQKEFSQLINYCDYIVFNSFPQWRRFRPILLKAEKSIQPGLRINPRYSEIKVDIYNPCVRHSRLGITREEFNEGDLDDISGLHFHTMCEQNVQTLERTLKVVAQQFGHLLGGLRWVNFGGGQHITSPGYDKAKLCQIIRDFGRRYDLQVYLEPGEAVVLNAGILVASVLDIVHNEMDVAVLDASASTHMPDVLVMSYRPEVLGAAEPNVKPHTYRLAGPTCLAGDIAGDYSFDEPLKVGSKVIFLDMAHYTMVKNNTFNGVALPSIALYTPQAQQIKIIRQFDYTDYKSRLS